MTLPLIFPPSSLPLFRADGINVTLRDDYAGVPRGRGHSRKRPKTSGAPRSCSVAWHLTYAQMIALDTWGEVALNVWTEDFTAELPNMGPGRLFWRAKWAEMPRMIPVATPRGPEWAVTGTIVLKGDGEALRPTTGELLAEVLVQRLGSGTLVLPDVPLAGEILVARIAITVLAGEIIVHRSSTITPLSGEITVDRDGSGALSSGGSGGTGTGTIEVGEEDGSPLADVSSILFPPGSISYDSNGAAIYTPVPDFYYQASAPTGVAGRRWLSSVTGILYTWFDDGTSTQWVEL